MSTCFISSLQNSRVKDVVRLANRRQRDAAGTTVVEGVREVLRALESGVVPHEAFVCPELLDAEGETAVARLSHLSDARQTQLCTVTPEVFAKMAYRGQSGGLLLVVPYLRRTLDDLPLGERPFLAVIDGAEKPGNLGAILRTADTAGVDGLIVTNDDAGTDIHNPNVVRASLGALFTVPVVETATDAAVAWLHARQIAIVAALPDAQPVYTAVDLTGPVAIVMGSEAHGLSHAWRSAADVGVRIPMYGRIDSLNLSIATALLLYETVRQRGAVSPNSG